MLSPVGLLVESPERSDIKSKDQTLERESSLTLRRQQTQSSPNKALNQVWENQNNVILNACHYITYYPLKDGEGQKHNPDSLKYITQNVKQTIKDYKIHKESGKCDPWAISGVSPSHYSLFVFYIYKPHIKSIDKWSQKVTCIKMCSMEKLRRVTSKS